MKISLPHNIATATTVDELKQQLLEVLHVLEDTLNRTVTVYYRDDVKKPYPTAGKGDLLFDITEVAGTDTLRVYEFNGKVWVPLTFSSLAGSELNLDEFEITGTIDLIEHGSGSGNDPTLYLKSDGMGGWMLAPVPDPITNEPLSNGMLPNPEIVFDGVSGDVMMHPV